MLAQLTTSSKRAEMFGQLALRLERADTIMATWKFSQMHILPSEKGSAQREMFFGPALLWPVGRAHGPDHFSALKYPTLVPVFSRPHTRPHPGSGDDRHGAGQSM